MSKYSEVNLAERLVARYGLKPPIDLESLASRYAIVEEMPFPVDADGITLFLKVLGKRPHIIINSNAPPRRKRFTLAHELGQTKALYSACMQKLHSKPLYLDFIKHPDFAKFMVKKIDDLLK